MSYKRKKNIIIVTVLLLTGSMVFLIFSLLSDTKSKGNIVLSALIYVVDCCILFFNRVTSFIILEKFTLAYLGLAFIAFGLVEGLWNLISGLKKTKELSAKFEIVKKIKLRDSIVLNIFSADNISTAFTMGFLRPEIYISSGMWKTLYEEEIKSVIAHEEHHVIERDPLKVLLLRFLGEIFFFVPLIKHLLKKFEETMEKSADDYVRTKGINELLLASALLKVQKSNGLIVPVASFADIDGKGLVESRVIRLLQPGREKQLRIPKKIIAATAFLYMILLISAFTLPDNMRRPTGDCIYARTHSSCPQMTPEECRKHCEQIKMEKR